MTSASVEGSWRERRRHVRVNLVTERPFTQAACCGGLGKVLDISLGGLAILTENEAHGNPGVREVDLFFANALLCIRGVPCRLVSFRKAHPEGAGPETPLFRGGYQFLSLTKVQRTQLRFAICLNAGPGTEWPREDLPNDSPDAELPDNAS